MTNRTQKEAELIPYRVQIWISRHRRWHGGFQRPWRYVIGARKFLLGFRRSQPYDRYSVILLQCTHGRNTALEKRYHQLAHKLNQQKLRRFSQCFAGQSCSSESKTNQHELIITIIKHRFNKRKRRPLRPPEVSKKQ